MTPLQRCDYLLWQMGNSGSGGFYDNEGRATPIGTILSLLFCHDLVFNFVVGGLRNNLFLDQLIFPSVRPTFDDLVSIGITNAGEPFELICLCTVQVYWPRCVKYFLARYGQRKRTPRSSPRLTLMAHLIAVMSIVLALLRSPMSEFWRSQ